MRTIVFTVHEPPNPPADRIDRAEQLEFVRDGFVPLAAAIPPLWMLMQRLWIALLIYLLLSMGLSLALGVLGVDKSLIGLINLAANVVIGFEASSIQRWTLGRRDWSEIGTVVGRNRAECERRFFDGWLVEQPLLRRMTAAAPQSNEDAGVPKPLSQRLASASAGDGSGNANFNVAPGPLATEMPANQNRPLWRRLLRR